MRNNRLFEIIYILLDKRKVTSKELAERFEVSVRTIYRDIDALSLAGIPVYTEKGKGGGISLMEGFVLQNSLLSEEERDRILMGLQSLRAVQYPETEEVLSKLSAVFQQEDRGWIEVDFSAWGTAEKEKFALLKEAVLKKEVITFTYFGANGKKEQRTVEPLRLLYKSRAWYLQGFCRDRRDYRTFRISRIKNPEMTGELFKRSAGMLPQEAKKGGAQEYVRFVLHIDPQMTYRVYDEFEEGAIQKLDDGFLVEMNVPEDEWVYGYILSFGPFAYVVKPERVRRVIGNRLKKMLENYV